LDGHPPCATMSAGYGSTWTWTAATTATRPVPRRL